MNVLPLTYLMISKSSVEASKMSQYKPGDCSSIPGTHVKVEGKNQLHKFASHLHAYVKARSATHAAYTHKLFLNKNLEKKTIFPELSRILHY